MSGSGSEGGEWFDDFDDSLTASDSDAGGAAAAEASPARGGAQRVPLYRVLDAAELEAAATAATDQVRAILGCAAAAARALLAPFGWDAEALLTTLAERGEAAVYGRAGLPPPGAAPAAPPAPDAAGAAACGVCLADVPARELLAPAACGHSFCRECWATHAAVAVRGGLGAALRCMAPRCGAPVADAAAEALLAGAEGGALAARRRRQLLDAFVDGNRAVRWCPSVPHCGRAARAARGPHVECDCACGARFCFACGEAPHSPASCAMMADWARRLREGTETSQWLSAHTKPCPRCAKPVEKNGGCNLVLCRCGQAFCWLCGRGTGRAHTWTAIEGHACGAYRGEAESRASGAQRNLARYLHYLTRHEAHLESLRAEERARAALEARIAAAAAADAAGVGDAGWLHGALGQLFAARRALAHSYVLAYYAFGGELFAADLPAGDARTARHQALFEDKQGRLEVEVERLARLVEATPPAELPALRGAVVNLAATIDTRVVRLYEVVEHDIAGALAGASLEVAPYRGRRTAPPPRGFDEALEADAAAADAAAAAVAAGAGAAGAGAGAGARGEAKGEALSGPAAAAKRARTG